MRGFELMDNEEVTEKVQAIKGPDEIKAMRCASLTCDYAYYAMESFTREEIPNGNMNGVDVWAVLHTKNIKCDGKWIEKWLLASGPHTNPWFQECGRRAIQNN